MFFHLYYIKHIHLVLVICTFRYKLTAQHLCLEEENLQTQQTPKPEAQEPELVPPEKFQTHKWFGNENIELRHIG